MAYPISFHYIDYPHLAPWYTNRWQARTAQARRVGLSVEQATGHLATHRYQGRRTIDPHRRKELTHPWDSLHSQLAVLVGRVNAQEQPIAHYS